MTEWHARTPGHAHEWFTVRLGDATLSTCSACDYWYIQPSLPMAEPSDPRGDQGAGYSGRHADREDDVRRAREDASRFYNVPMGRSARESSPTAE